MIFVDNLIKVKIEIFSVFHSGLIWSGPAKPDIIRNVAYQKKRNANA